jgi:hypothetical protein
VYLQSRETPLCRFLRSLIDHMKKITQDYKQLVAASNHNLKNIILQFCGPSILYYFPKSKLKVLRRCDVEMENFSVKKIFCFSIPIPFHVKTTKFSSNHLTRYGRIKAPSLLLKIEIRIISFFYWIKALFLLFKCDRCIHVQLDKFFKG